MGQKYSSGGQILLYSGVKINSVRGKFLIRVKNTLVRGLAQVYIENDSSSSDSETISDPRAVKKRKIASNDEAQTEGSGSQTQSTNIVILIILLI